VSQWTRLVHFAGVLAINSVISSRNAVVFPSRLAMMSPDIDSSPAAIRAQTFVPKDRSQLSSTRFKSCADLSCSSSVAPSSWRSTVVRISMSAIWRRSAAMRRPGTSSSAANAINSSPARLDLQFSEETRVLAGECSSGRLGRALQHQFFFGEFPIELVLILQVVADGRLDV